MVIPCLSNLLLQVLLAVGEVEGDEAHDEADDDDDEVEVEVEEEEEEEEEEMMVGESQGVRGEAPEARAPGFGRRRAALRARREEVREEAHQR